MLIIAILVVLVAPITMTMALSHYLDPNRKQIERIFKNKYYAKVKNTRKQNCSL